MRVGVRMAAVVAALWVMGCETGEPADEPPVADAGRPDAGPPDPGRTPTPTPGVTLRWGAASVLLTLEGAGGGPESTVTVALFDADGAPMGELAGAPGLFPIPDPWTRFLWWPASSRPASAIVRVMDGEDVLIEQMVDHIVDMPLAEDGCDATGFTERCGAGRVCVTETPYYDPGPGRGRWADADARGTCVAVDMTAWQVDELVLVDIQGDAAPGSILTSVGAPGLDGFTTFVPTVRTVDDRWRAHGWLRDPVPPRVDLYAGPHLVTADVPVGEVLDRRVGEPCDPLRLTDRCVEGTACGPDGTCRAISAPQLDRLTASGEGQRVAVVFDGVDAEGDVESLHIDLLAADGERLHRADYRFDWFSRPNRFGSIAFVGGLEQDGGRVAGHMVLDRDDIPRPVARVRVALEDAEGLIGNTLEADVGPVAPVRVGPDARCDPYNFVTTCPDGLVCERPDGESGPMTCIAPDRDCADRPVLVDRVEGNNGPAPDITEASCTWSRGNIGNEESWAFTAERTGTHVFRAEGEQNAATTLFARRACDLAWQGTSEIGCVHREEVGEGVPLVLPLELQAGQTVYIFVEASWFGPGAYTLEVEAP